MSIRLGIYRLLILLFVIIGFGSCDIVEDSAGGAEPPPPRDNPRDPQNEEGVLADLILSGGFSFDTIFTVSTNEVVFEWATSGDGIASSLQYRYKYASYNQNIDDVAFSNYITEQRFEYFGLDESLTSNDLHEIQIEVSSSVNSEIEPKLFSASFLVNKVQSPGFVFNPTRISQEVNGTYFLNLLVDEIIASDEIVAYRLDLLINSDEVNISNSDVNMYQDASSFFYRSDATIFSLSTVIGDTLRIESAIGGNNLASVEGYGNIGVLAFRLQNGVNSSRIRVSPRSFFVLSDGTELPISQFDSAELNNSF